MRIVQLLLAVSMLLLAAFCAFGFLASLEPGVSHATAWRIGYGALGVIGVAAAAMLALPALRSRRGGQRSYEPDRRQVHRMITASSRAKGGPGGVALRERDAAFPIGGIAHCSAAARP